MNRAREVLAAEAFGIPGLITSRHGHADVPHLRAAISEMPHWATRDLLPRFETTTDPVILWGLHLVAERRGLPPVLRWPGHQLGPQGDLIALAADVRWLLREAPRHKAVSRGWRSVLRQPCGSESWHDRLLSQFLYSYPRGLAHLASRGLGLSESQRQMLLSVPTATMRRERAALEGAAFSELMARLLDHAVRHPDRSGQRTAEQIASRRARMYRVHVLTGRSPSRTAAYWQVMTGEVISRQAAAKQIEAVG